MIVAWLYGGRECSLFISSGPWAEEFQTVRTEFKEKRLDKSAEHIDRRIRKISSAMTGDPEEFTLRNISLPIKINADNALPSFTERKHSPAAWSKAGFTCEYLTSIGAPFFNRTKGAATRGGNEHCWVDGLARLFMPVSENTNAVVIAFPSRAFLELGVSQTDHWDFLATLTIKEFDCFIEKNCWHAMLTDNTAVWIPYGYCCTVTSIGQPTEVQYAMCFSWINEKMWKQIEDDMRCVA